MKFKPKQITDRIPEGTYQGTITEQSESFDGKYLWLKIEMEDRIELLNISIPVNTPLLNNFAISFQDKNGEVDTSDFVGITVEFTVADKNICGNVYSKFTALEPVWEEDEDNA